MFTKHYDLPINADEIAHDIKNPVAIIDSAAQLIKNNQDIPDEIIEYCNMIQKQCEMINDLINHLQKNKPLADESILIHMVPLDIVSLIRKIIDMCIPFSQKKSIIIYFNSNTLEKNMLVNKIDFKRIMLNLITNSIKHTPYGKNIYVSFTDYGKSVTISVKDDGLGVDEDFLPFIFDKYAQDGPGFKDGHGLGLHIVKTLVEESLGAIEAHSTSANYGLEIIFSLPTYPIPGNNYALIELPIKPLSS